MNGFSSKWRETEERFAKVFNAELVTHLALQYKDIDAVLPDGRTVSIKDIGESSKRYGSILLETTLLSTQRGTEMPGSFHKCEADLFAIWLFGRNRFGWYVIETHSLRAYLSDHPQLPTVRTRAETEARNREQGRVYDGTICVRILVEDLLNNTSPIALPRAQKGYKASI